MVSQHGRSSIPSHRFPEMRRHAVIFVGLAPPRFGPGPGRTPRSADVMPRWSATGSGPNPTGTGCPKSVVGEGGQVEFKGGRGTTASRLQADPPQPVARRRGLMWEAPEPVERPERLARLWFR